MVPIGRASPKEKPRQCLGSERDRTGPSQESHFLLLDQDTPLAERLN